MYNLFISHSWTYGDAYERLVDLLREQSSFFFRNYSVPKDNPIHNAQNDWQLAAAINAQIMPCDAVIVLAGVYATYSKWINIEVAIAKSQHKPIIAIQPWGAERTSKFVCDNATRTVGWRASSVVEAVRDLTYTRV